MRKLHLLLLPALVLPLALGLAACGGGESDEDAVIETIETSATSTDPADCEALATQAFLEQTQYSEGPDAVKSCEDDAEEAANDPESVDVSKVEINGSKATADVAFEGGTFDAQTVSVSLVEEDGDWKMNEITGFVDFDQDRLAQSFEEGVTEGEDALPKAVGSCLGEEFRDLPAAEFEEIVIGGDVQPLVEIVEGCQQ